MPYYNHIHWKMKNPHEKKRTVENLLHLREQLDGIIPSKDAEDTLLLATWNIRDFGKPLNKPRGWGPRLPETWFYIAEIISRFDFVAVQEVNELTEWNHIMEILGRQWDFIATDATDPALGGNGERMTFVYDTRKVGFQNIAGEIVLPPKYLISKTTLEVQGKNVIDGKQFARTPFIASFQSGWLKFDICTVHIYYGAGSGDKLKQRIGEIETITTYLSKRADRALGKERALILLGDFNIISPEHRTMQALTEHGFVVPKILQQNPTTATNKHYDQIGFKTKSDVVEYIERRSQKPLNQNAGVIPIFEQVFKKDHVGEYADFIKTKTSAGKKVKTNADLERVYLDWRTYQLSDHYPMWVRLKTDGSGAYLERLLQKL